MHNQKELIQNILRYKRVAVIGVSRNPRDFTRTLWTAFRVRGYDAIPVHPEQELVEGIPCFANIRAITPKPDWALILVPKIRRKDVLEDCLAAGIRLVWIFGIRGKKDVGDDLLRLCEQRNIEVVAGFCPFMFLPETPFFHRVHGAVSKLVGAYPK